MKVSDLVNKHLLSVDLKSRTRDALLTEILALIDRHQKLPHKEDILRELVRRENEETTGGERGIAIPHARIADLKKEIFFVGISRSGILFGPAHTPRVRLVFLFLSPLAETETHLKILSLIASLVKHKNLTNRLIRARTESELFDMLMGTETDRTGFAALTEQEIYLEIGTSSRGLSEEEAQRRKALYGPNRLKRTGGISLWRRFQYNFTNLLAVLMWGGSLLAFLAGIPEVGWAIIAVIVINGLFSFWQEFRAEKALDALRDLIPSFIRVVRDGGEKRIPAEDVAPGDVILIEEGDNITADARLIEAHELRVDSSVFSGESRARLQKRRPPVRPRGISVDGNPQPDLRRNQRHLRNREGRGHRNGNEYRTREDRLSDADHPGGSVAPATGNQPAYPIHRPDCRRDGGRFPRDRKRLGETLLCGSSRFCHRHHSRQCT